MRIFRFIVSSFAFLTLVCLGPCTHVYAQQKASPAEIEDLGFIRNLFKDKVYTFARQEAQSFHDNYPDSVLTPDVIFIQAQINVIEGEFNKTLKQYSLIINQFPDSPLVEDALYFTGALKLQLNQQEGLVYFDRVLVKFPDTKYLSQINFHRGEQAFEEKNWITAEPYFKSVLKAERISDEMRLKTQHYLAWIYYFKGNLLLAKSLFFELLESDIAPADKAKIAFQLGVDFQKKQSYKKAVFWYEKQMKEWPDPDYQGKSRFWIAECYYLQYRENPEKSPAEDKQKAIDLFSENLSSKRPVSPLISRYHRGWLFYAMDRKPEAEKDFSWLQTNNTEYAADLELTAIRASFFEKSNKLAEANRIYVQALEHQKEHEIRNMLLISIFRNSYSLKDCASILKWKNEADLSAGNKDATEISFYTGQCHFEKKEWQKAGEDFARIPLETRYARVVFASFLTVFRKTGDLQGGMDYLTSVENRPRFGDLTRILLLKLDFCMNLKQWAQAVEVMLRIEKEVPGKAKDPWFLLNIAKTADSVKIALADKNNAVHRYPVRKKNFYDKLALKYYQVAYSFLPQEDDDTRLSILDILISRYQARSDLKRVVAMYRTAITLVKERQKQDELRFLIASILLNDLKQKNEALKELHKVHKSGNTEIHYKASSLLAELYIEKAKYIQAIKILEDLAGQPIKNTSWFPLTHFRLGELYQTKERWEKAVFHYELVSKSKQKSQFKADAKSRAATIKKYLEQQKSRLAEQHKQKQAPVKKKKTGADIEKKQPE